jgi:tight adherence protein B
MKWLWVAFVFTGLASLIFMAFPGRRVTKRRLGIEREKVNLSQSMDSFLERHGRRQGLAHALHLAGIETEPGVFALRVVLAALVLTIVGFIISPVLAIVGLVAPFLGARMIVSAMGRKRQEAFAAQLPDVLQLLIASLRSGHSLPQALDAMVSESDQPARSEFERMLIEARLGQDFHAAMRATAERMGSEDLEWVASAVEINREAGGNLAEVLSNVNETVRGRYRLRRLIKTLTAEGRISLKVLTIIPLAAFAVRSLFDQKFRDVMFHGIGPMVLAYGAASLLLGWVIVRRLIAVKGV